MKIYCNKVIYWNKVQMPTDAIGINKALMARLAYYYNREEIWTCLSHWSLIVIV